MPKSLYIAEKPSVAREFAKALKEPMKQRDGWMESENAVVTWCVGHLVTMSYPEKYDEKYRKWSFETLPFLPETFKYEVIPAVKKQYDTVKTLLLRQDVDTIYVCTDSGREGEYIYRLVAMMAGVKGKIQKRVWIDSQTEEEILRGIREAKDLKEYDHLADSAYLRAKEDYLMGINFSRALSLKYSYGVMQYLGGKYQAISVGRVMTCVLGMVVQREREIRSFVKTPFYRVIANQAFQGQKIRGEWRAVQGSAWYQSPFLYKENGFREKEQAEKLIAELKSLPVQETVVEQAERKKETRNPPLLYNLAELQNDCSRLFRISPDQTLSLVQELYEKKLVTYPRTDARVLSSAVAKEIRKNISGLAGYGPASEFVSEILKGERWKGIGKSRYTNDKQITDHYAIIPTGQGISALPRLSELSAKVYEQIVRRFLSIFYPPAVYQKFSLVTSMGKERFFSGFRVLSEEGYLKVAGRREESRKKSAGGGSGEEEEQEEDISCGKELLDVLSRLKKGSVLAVEGYEIKEGETSPPRRYTSGSMILAMENAGQLIEDEELRAQIRGSGIGTSATRAEILKKLFSIRYLSLNRKTQIITPTQMGEIVYDVVDASIRPLLKPEMTASWEKGLTYVAEGSITPEEYMEKLEHFVSRHTLNVQKLRNQTALKGRFDAAAAFYQKKRKSRGKTG
jgi:DNA topoisomerase-3